MRTHRALWMYPPPGNGACVQSVQWYPSAHQHFSQEGREQVWLTPLTPGGILVGRGGWSSPARSTKQISRGRSICRPATVARSAAFVSARASKTQPRRRRRTGARRPLDHHVAHLQDVVRAGGLQDADGMAGEARVTAPAGEGLFHQAELAELAAGGRPLGAARLAVATPHPVRAGASSPGNSGEPHSRHQRHAQRWQPQGHLQRLAMDHHGRPAPSQDTT